MPAVVATVAYLKVEQLGRTCCGEMNVRPRGDFGNRRALFHCMFFFCFVTLEIFTAVTIKNGVFWDV
jgi:hypothetical protein